MAFAYAGTYKYVHILLWTVDIGVLYNNFLVPNSEQVLYLLHMYSKYMISLDRLGQPCIAEELEVWHNKMSIHF